MCSKGFFRRIVPFFATFAIGMFVASFFVTIGAPRFNFGEGRRRHCEERFRRDNQLRIENEQLRNQLETLRAEKQGLRTRNMPAIADDGLVRPPAMDDDTLPPSRITPPIYRR